MEQIVIDGVTYEKASKIAKQFRYTTDYVGQLCRSGKVDAKLVGRSWFVNPETIRDHQRSRYKRTDSAKDGESVQSSQVSEKNPPNPSGSSVQPKNFFDRITWNKVSYETDESDLLPNLQKKNEKEESLTLEVSPAA